MKKLSKELIKGKVSAFKGKHPQFFSGLVLALIICAVSATVIFGAQAISNLWQSEPIDVEAQELVITSSNFTIPTTVSVGIACPFTLTVDNPNPSSIPDYVDAVASITIFGDVTLTPGDVVLVCGSVVPLIASDGNLTGVLPCIDDTIPPAFSEDYELQVLFSKLGEYMIEVQITGSLGS